MRRLHALAILLIALAAAPLGAGAQTLSASPASLYSSQAVSAAWSAIAAPTATDWIALYAVGAPDNAFIAWRYTDGTAAGSAPLTVPASAAAGSYELRLFANNVYTLLATSNSFSVQTPAPASLSASPAAVTVGQGASATLSAAWSAIFAPSATDWIALIPAGAPHNAFIAWRYTDGTAAGSAPFTVPASTAAGSYELRLFSNNVYTLLATSNSLTVQNPPPASLAASPASVEPGQPVGATWSGIFAPSSTDWIALYRAGTADNAFIAWRYTDGSAAGSAPLTVPASAAAGSYELRLFANNVYTLLATSNSFSVASPSLPLQLHFIHVDHLNTPRLVTNQTGQAVWRWDNQEPFGDTPPDENPSGVGTFTFPLRFGGWQYADDETGAFWNWHRTYSRLTGRFDQSDRLGLIHHLNTYAYANLNPLSYVDPTGEAATLTWCLGGPIACAAGATAAVGSLIWATSQSGKKGSGASTKSAAQCPPDDRDDYCEKVRAREEALCEAIAGPRYPGNPAQAITICKKAAFQRYIKCRQGLPEHEWPPLTGVDTPI